jgi:hypothetical protein
MKLNPTSQLLLTLNADLSEMCNVIEGIAELNQLNLAPGDALKLAQALAPLDDYPTNLNKEAFVSSAVAMVSQHGAKLTVLAVLQEQWMLTPAEATAS